MLAIFYKHSYTSFFIIIFPARVHDAYIGVAPLHPLNVFKPAKPTQRTGMLLQTFLVLVGVGLAFAAVAAISRDSKFLYLAGAMFILTAGMLLYSGSLQVPTGEETTIPSPTTRQSAATLQQSVDVFGHQVNKQYDTIFDFESTRPISIRRDRVFTSDAPASVDQVGGEYRLSISTTLGGSTANFSTATRSVYTSGITALWGLGLREAKGFDTSQSQWQAGLFDQENGMYLGRNGTGYFAALRFNGTETSRVFEDEWNGRTDLDLEKLFREGVIIQGRFVYYGYGGGGMDAVFYLVPTGVNLSDRLRGPVRIHSFEVVNRSTFTSLNLPLSVKLEKESSSGTDTVFVGGRHFSLLGEYNPVSRITDVNTSTSIDDTWTPVVSWRHRPGAENIPLELNGFTALTECDAEWQWRIHRNTSFQNMPSWQVPYGESQSETQLEFADDSDVPWDAGTSVDSGYLRGGEGSRVDVGGRLINEDLPNHLYATLYFRGVPGTSNCQIRTVSRLQEDY